MGRQPADKILEGGFWHRVTPTVDRCHRELVEVGRETQMFVAESECLGSYGTAGHGGEFNPTLADRGSSNCRRTAAWRR